MFKNDLTHFRVLAGKLQDWTSQDTNGVPTGNIHKTCFSHDSHCEINYLTHFCPQLSFGVQIKSTGSLDMFVHECLQESCREKPRVPIGLFENSSDAYSKTLTQISSKSKTSLRGFNGIVSQ